jgi:hypothetical protein
MPVSEEPGNAVSGTAAPGRRTASKQLAIFYLFNIPNIPFILYVWSGVRG